MKKKIIIPLSLISFLAVVLLVIKMINIGVLTIRLIEKFTGVEIKYATMHGSILKGFRFTDYQVRLNETDSLAGGVAEINYRLSAVHFGLPSLIEINLLEPRVVLQRHYAASASKPFKLPILNLGLRIIVKNGQFQYRDQRAVYSVRRVAGLVFLDFIGSRLQISTMNLSGSSDNWPVSLTTLNLNMVVTNRALTVKSCRGRGPGFFLDVSGIYQFQERNFNVNLHQAEADLAAFNVGSGRITAAGKISYIAGRWRPRLYGSLSGRTPVERVNYETNYLQDTVLINLFDGRIYDGGFFAEIKIDPDRHISLAANCRDINIGPLIGLNTPMRVSGFVSYQKESFSGLVNLNTPGHAVLDSIRFFGRFDRQGLQLDSLITRRGNGALAVAGPVLPTCSLTVTFDRYAPDFLAWSGHFDGLLNGKCQVRGNLRRPAGLVWSADLKIENLIFMSFHCQTLLIKARDYRFPFFGRTAIIQAVAPGYQQYRLDSLTLEKDVGQFILRGHRGSDSIWASGAMDDSGQGTIERAGVIYRAVSMISRRSIGFNLWPLRFGDFDLELLGGSVRGSIAPLRLTARDIDLASMKQWFKQRESIQGAVDADYDGRRLTLQARDIEFRGLSGAGLELDVQRQDQGLIIDRLEIHDQQGQSLSLKGYLSEARSALDIQAENFGTWPLFFLNRILENQAGRVSGKARISGNLKEFKMEGDARVEEFSFGLKVIEARFDSIRSEIRFDGDRIHFRNARGRIYSTGYNKIAHSAEVTGGGTVRLEEKFKTRALDFEFAFRDAPIQYPPIVYGRGTGNLRLSMKDGVPYYGGVITVKEGVVPIDFGTQFPTPEPGVKVNENWRMNLKIAADRDVWLRNRSADIEFGGELFVIKEQGPLYLAGQLKARRGDFYWFSHTLRATEGTLTFVPADIIDPQIDVRAELNSRERSLKTNEEIKVILHCSGTIMEPVFEFYSEPPEYSEQDILTYLNLNVTWRELESIQRGEYVGKALPKSLLALLENDVSIRIRKYTGVDVLQIQAPLFDPEQSTKLTVGKYVSRNLFVSYTYDFTYYANQFNVEYFIDDKNEIMVRRDETGAYSLEYRYRIRF